MNLSLNLSTEAAKYWLGLFEMVLLVSAGVLVVGLVDEWPETKGWKASVWFKAAKLAVVLGVLGELARDGGIFATSSRLQKLQEAEFERLSTDNLSLQTQMAPRNLSVDDRNTISRGLEPFRGQHIVIN